MSSLTRRLTLSASCWLFLWFVTQLNAQVASLSATSLNFGNQAAGTTSSTRTVRLTNTGTPALVISGITPPSTPFAESNDCPSSLAHNAFCRINVTFSPSALGAFSGSISIADNASGSPQTITMTGTGVQPITLSPSSVSFGRTTLGNSSSAKTVTLRNVQNVPLTINSITTSANFSQTNNCPTPPSTLAAGGTCAISAVFTPSSLGAVSGTLTVTHNAFGFTTTGSLSGTGINPVALAPSSLTFAAQNIGTTSASKTIQVTNAQSVALSISSIQTTGDFSESNTCPLAPQTLAAGVACTVTVKFSPLAAGTRTGQLLINDNAVGSPQSAGLTGAGVAVLQSISVLPATATIAVGQTQQFVATGTYNDGSQKNITSSVRWSSTRTSVATVSAGGLATGVRNGTATISATMNGITGTATLTVGGVAPPVIGSFTAGASTITAGNSTALTAVFSGGTGTINNGVGAVTSGAPVTITPAATTTYTLTVSNGAGSVTATATVTVVPAPAITSFTAGASTITTGNSTNLTGVFSGGTGTINNGAGAVTSGTPVTITPAATTTYTLTVTNAAGTSVTSTVTVNVVAGLFSNGPSLDIVAHTATLLNNGTVLIAGGVTSGDGPNPNGSIVNPQLYDPLAGTFTNTGAMYAPRSSHTATLLNNGTVLIVGGSDTNGNLVVGGEIYDPVTGTFSPTTGGLNVPRINHTATLLANGTVLITGGSPGSYGSATNSAEIYDPVAGTFSLTTNTMTAARWNHMATLLNNGTVLIAGGEDASFNNQTSAEVYDPVAQTFTAVTSPMNAPRSSYTATLLNDATVLIAGCDGIAATTAELYTSTGPTTGNFMSTGSMSTGRCSASATLLNNGTVLVAGGINPSGNPNTAAELYDPNSGSFTPTGSLNTGRYQSTSTRLNNGNVLVVGGWTSNQPPNNPTNSELYQPVTQTPPNLISISVAPANPTIVVGEAMRFIATGTYQNNSTQQLASATWSSSNTAIAQTTNDATNFGVGFGVTSGTTTIQGCAGGTCGSTTVTVGASPNYTQLPATPGNSFGMGMVFVPSDLAGGTNYTLLFEGHSVSTWTFSSGSWTLHNPVNSPSTRDGVGMAYDASTQTVVLFGGSSSGNDMNDTWIWDGTNWTQANPSTVPPGRRFDTQGMAYLPSSGTVVMFGGVTQGGGMFGDTWTWNGVNQSWTQQAPASSPSARRAPLAYDPSTGRVLLFGGEGSYGGPTYGDTWLWDGGSWSQQSPATSPPARSMASMAFDSALGNLVLFGGSQAGSGAPYFSDTWLWDGTTWSPFYPPGGAHPPERYAFGMAYDPSQGVLIYGGLDISDSVTLNDMWSLTP